MKFSKKNKNKPTLLSFYTDFFFLNQGGKCTDLQADLRKEMMLIRLKRTSEYADQDLG